MADGLIELGERAELPTRSRPGPRSQRRTLAGLAAVAVLLGVTGSGGSPPRLSDPVWTIAGVDGFRVGSDTIYGITSGTVEARAADTGRLRWRHPTGGRVDDMVEIGHGLVAISFGPPAQSAANTWADTTIVARATTGDVVATIDGVPLGWSRERLLVVRDGCGSRPDCDTLSAISLPDAATRWRVQLPAMRTFSVDDAAGVFAVQTDDELQLRALTTGTALRSQPLPQSADTDGSGSGPLDRSRQPPAAYGAVLAGRLVTVRRIGSQIMVDGQPLAAAASGWSVTLPADPGRSAPGFLLARTCGPLICVFVDVATTVIEPDTGALRGHIAGSVLAGPFTDLSPQSLVVQSSADQNVTGLEVLRARDLSVVASAPLATPMSWQSSDGRVMFSRFTPDGISLTVIDRHGYQRPIGTVAGSEVRCLAYALILTCLDQRTLTTRRIPSVARLAAGVGDGRP